MVTMQKIPQGNFMYDGTFFEAVSPVLIVAQFFGIMPLYGLRSKCFLDLKFNLISLRTFYSLVCIVGISCICLANFAIMFQFGFDFGKFVTTMFYTGNLLGLICLLNLAKHWKVLMQSFNRVESKLPPFETHHEKYELFLKIRFISRLMLSMGLGKYELHFQ